MSIVCLANAMCAMAVANVCVRNRNIINNMSIM